MAVECGLHAAEDIAGQSAATDGVETDHGARGRERFGQVGQKARIGRIQHEVAAVRAKLVSWTPESKPQPDDLVQTLLERRGGALLNLDRALLWNEPLACG